MRFLLSILILLALSNQGICYTFTTYSPPEVIQNNGYTSYPKISQIESIVFNKTYETEDIETRLRRLEKKTCSQIFPSADLAWRVDNIMTRIDQSALYNIPSKDLAKIERNVLGRSYVRDKIETRLSRLEQKMLGATQSGKPDERYQTILSASNHYTDFENLANPINTAIGTSSGNLKNAFQNIFSSIFSNGCMTGYTPPISPYGYNTPYGLNPQSGIYGPITPRFDTVPYIPYGNNGYHRSLRTNTGYYNMNRNCSSGCGIHILD